MNKKKHPAISFHLSLPNLLLLLLAIAGFFTFIVHEPTSPLAEALHQVKAKPHSVSLHLALAKAYESLHLYNKVQSEVDIGETWMTPFVVSSHYPSAQVLGTTDFKTHLSQKTQTQQKLEKYWTEVTNSTPNYRDGYVQLYYLAYNSQREEEINKLRSKITELDPNYVLPTKATE